MVRRLLLAIAIAMLIPLAPAQAVGESLGAVVVDGPLRAGAFSQVFHATAGGLNAATMIAVVEQQSGPGTITGTDVRITAATQVVGQLTASASGAYVVQLCIAPKASPTCAGASAVKAFSVGVAGPPTSITMEPSVQSAAASTAVPYVVKVVDSAARTTLLAAGESVSVATAVSAGTATVEGVDTPLTGLNPRLRSAGIGSFTVANDVAGSTTDITVSALGFTADTAVAYLATDPPPQDIQLVLDEPVSVTTLGATVEITGVVLDAAGDPIAGAVVGGAIDGIDSGVTSTDTTGSDGRFAVNFISASSVSGQHDDVDLDASEVGHGSDQSRAVVYFTANGRTPISDVSIDSVPISTYTGSISTPVSGIAATAQDTAALISFIASVPGATVEVTTQLGALTLVDDASWSGGRASVAVVTDSTGLGRVYLHSTKAGSARVEVAAARTAVGAVQVVTVPSGARNVSLTATAHRVRAGERAMMTVSVEDAFGNPIDDARIDLALRNDSAGHFVSGGRQTTVRTDADGNAVVEVATGPKERGEIRVVARGDSPECGARNQYACPVNEPGAGFAIAHGADAVAVGIVARIVRVTAPAFDSPVSTNQFIVVKASTRGISLGTLALLKTGHREVARATVGAHGSLVFPAIHATGDGVCAIAVAGMSTRVQVRIRAFGITRVHRGSRDAFTVATGTWRKGTTIVLLRDGRAIATSKVVRAHQAVVIRAPHRPGTYQVQVRTPLGLVRGARAWRIR